MSNQIFPVLQSPNWKMSRAPQWSTQVQTSVSLDRTRAPLQTSALWKWTLKNGILQTALGDLQAIQNLFNAMRGRWDTFLWLDPEGESIADSSQQVSIGGNSYWPVAFTHDAVDFDRFAYQLWECGTLEFEQVKQPTGGVSFPIVPPASNSIAITITASTSFSIATGTVAGSHIDGSNPTIIAGGGALASDSSSYGLRSNSLVLGSNDIQAWSGGFQVRFFVDNPIGTIGSVGWSASLNIYDVYADITSPDATITRVRPSRATMDNQGAAGFGAIANPTAAIDGDPSTFATLTRTEFDPLDFFNTFVVTF